jgi:Uma2 family endonuclease
MGDKTLDLALVYSMTQSPFTTVTLEEFLRQPETEPASEYIDGKIFQKPMPRGKHSILQGELVSGVNLVLKPRRIARTFPELRCTFGGRSIVPDVAVFEWKNIPTDESGEVMDVFS